MKWCTEFRAKLLACTALASVALANRPLQAQHSDVLVTSVGGQVAVGSAEDIDGPDEAFELGANVFESILRAGFAPPAPADYESDEPGFFALHAVNDAADLAALGAQALPASAAASIQTAPFTLRGQTDSLFYWNGAGAVNFQPISAVQPSVSASFDPPAFGTTGPNGELDDHPIYQIDHPGGTPADGVYLVRPRVLVDGLAPSDPFYIVMLVDALIQGEDELELVEHALEELEAGTADNALVDFGGGVTKDFAFYEEAVEWVAAIPEPGSAALAAFGLLGLTTMRRRRGGAAKFAA